MLMVKMKESRTEGTIRQKNMMVMRRGTHLTGRAAIIVEEIEIDQMTGMVRRLKK